jgi:hypothetical protein
VHHHYYRSSIVGINSEFYVYTPPPLRPQRQAAISGALLAPRRRQRPERMDSFGKGQCDPR